MAITVSGGGRLYDLDNGDNSVYASRMATVVGGNGDNQVMMMRGGVLRLGDGNNDVAMGRGGVLKLGSGHNEVAMDRGGLLQLSGNDTITLGVGFYMVQEQGTATVDARYGNATVSGGTLLMHSGKVDMQWLMSGDGVLQTEGRDASRLLGGSGNVTMIGGAGTTTFVGGYGSDTMVGGSGKDIFRIESIFQGGDHVIQNFTSGKDKLFLSQSSFAKLNNAGAISEHDGNTYITLDHGNTTIELQGVTGLHASDIITR